MHCTFSSPFGFNCCQFCSDVPPKATKFVVSLNKLVSGVGVVSRTASAVGAGAVSETGSCTYGSYICCLLNDGTGLGVWAISNPLYTARCRHRFA